MDPHLIRLIFDIANGVALTIAILGAIWSARRTIRIWKNPTKETQCPAR